MRDNDAYKLVREGDDRCTLWNNEECMAGYRKIVYRSQMKSIIISSYQTLFQYHITAL